MQNLLFYGYLNSGSPKFNPQFTSKQLQIVLFVQLGYAQITTLGVISPQFRNH